MRALLRQLRSTVSGRPERSHADPFTTLQMQARLSRLAEELHRLEQETAPQFARGHHARAASLAYHKTLLQACELAGVDVPEDDGSIATRLLAEASLLQAGWRW